MDRTAVIRAALRALGRNKLRTVFSLLGGAIGVPVGIVSSLSITSILGWPTTISATAVVAAVLFPIAVGVFFGYYRAQEAARLDPIEALRYE